MKYTFPTEEQRLPPEESFCKFFSLWGMTEEHRKEAFDLVFTKRTHGIHMRLVGSFFNVEGAIDCLEEFHTFVCLHRIPVQTLWVPRWPGGPDGFSFSVAPIGTCSLLWNDSDWYVSGKF
jgi:hypothetical protein